MTNPVPLDDDGNLLLLFAERDDVSDVFGNLSFGAAELEFVEETRGLPSMTTREALRRPDGSYVVYGYQARHNVKDMTWRIFRARTYDGVAYDDVEAVYESERGHWYGSTEIVHNGGDGGFLCLKWGPGHIQGGHAMWAFGSRDGAEWRPLLDRPVYHDHDAFSATWDPDGEQYVVFQATYQKHAAKPFQDNAGPDIRRVLSFRTSRDGVNWDPPGDITRLGQHVPTDRLMTPDENDPPELEFYRLTAFPHADRYLGMMLNYAPTPLTRGHGPHLGGEWWLGSDFRTWRRSFRDVFAPGPAPDIIMHPPITLRGRHLWVIHGKVYGVPENRLFYAASHASSAFTTRPFAAPQKRLFLNGEFPPSGRGFRGQSYVMVEALDENGQAIEGYEKEKCLLRELSARQTLLWGTPPETVSTAPLAGREIRLRIHFRDARICSVGTE